MADDQDKSGPLQLPKQRTTGGAMNAMAMLGLLFYQSEVITRKQFVNVSRDAAARCRIDGDTTSAKFLVALCNRLE